MNFILISHQSNTVWDTNFSFINWYQRYLHIMLTKFGTNQLKGVVKGLVCKPHFMLAVGGVMTMKHYWHILCDCVPSLNITVNLGPYGMMYSGIIPHFLFVWCNMLIDCLAMTTPFVISNISSQFSIMVMLTSCWPNWFCSSMRSI